MARAAFVLPIGGMSALCLGGALACSRISGAEREVAVAACAAASLAFAVACAAQLLVASRAAGRRAVEHEEARRAVESGAARERALAGELEAAEHELRKERSRKHQREGDFRQKTRSQILEAHSEIKLVLESIPSILVGVAKDGRVTHWNAAAEAAFGIAASGVIGRPFPDCGIDWDWSVMLGFRADDAMQGHSRRIEDMRFGRPGGASGFLSISLVWLPESATSASSLLLFMVDITERKHLELQSVQSLKLEAIGQLASGIAHEINTPTQYVGDNIRFMEDGFRAMSAVLAAHGRLVEAGRAALPAGLLAELERARASHDLDYIIEEFPKALAQSGDGIERIATIVQAMKEFSHPEPGMRKLADLNRSLGNTINVARNEYKYVAEVETRFDPELPPVPCYPGELNQVFLNVLINAAHAIAAAGRERQPGRITISTRRDGDAVVVGIADTGTGIPEPIRGRIYDPFFTTKGVGEGTGQGLYIARDIVVKRHQGTIAFETEMGKGTTFSIRLPLTGEPLPTSAAEHPSSLLFTRQG